MPKKKDLPLMEKQSTELESTLPIDKSTPIGTSTANVADLMMQSIGASGTKIFGGQIYEEYNPSLQGLKGLETYEEMRRSDAQVNACLLALELPIRSTLWYIESGSTLNAEGEEEVSDSDREISNFVQKALFEKMDITFDDFLRQALTMCSFWFSVFEKVWKEDGDKIVLRTLAQRLARTIAKWVKNKETGKYGVVQNILMNDENKPFEVDLPAEKVLIFTFRREGDNMEGVSVLRSAYKHWYIKDTLYKLDAVKHERQSVGIPIITLPETHNDDDGDKAEEILENIRSTEKSYIVLPSPSWKFEFAQMGSGTTIDTSASIEHHNREIVKNILAGFLDLWSKSSSGGSYALSEDQSSLFLLSLSALAQQITDTINKEIIQDLVDLNFTLTENQQYPKLRFQKLGEVKYEELAGSLSTLTGAGLITPDTGTEEYVRKIFDLPKKEMDEEGEDMEDMDEDEEAGDLESEADDEALQEEADSDESADDELTKLEEEMSKLEASEIEGVYEASLSYSDEDVSSFIFAMSPDEQTREKIRAWLIAYWERKGRKAKPTLKDRKDNFDSRAKDASGKIKDAMDKYKASIDPLKKQIETLTAQKKAGKLSKKQASAQIKQIKAQIKAIRDGKNEYVQTLKYIKRDAIQGKKQVKETIAKRKKAISAVIKQITEEVKAKNATRSEAIKSLALQIKASVQNYQKLKEQAKSKEEKAGLKSLYAQIKSENDTLRATAKSIREQAKSDRATAKAKKEEIKNTVQYSEQFGEEGYGGCVMLNIEAEEIKDFKISEEDLVDPSKSVEPYHVTLLYGLADALSYEEIKGKIKYSGQSPKVKKMSLFENEDADVLMLEIEKEEWISSINRSLKELEYKNDYPQYVPHVTLGYCKKGAGKKYLSEIFNGKKLTPLDVVHTSSEDDTPTILIPKDSHKMSEDEILAHNFSDRDEMEAFLQARKFFDPQVLIRVQNYGA